MVRILDADGWPLAITNPATADMMLRKGHAIATDNPSVIIGRCIGRK